MVMMMRRQRRRKGRENNRERQEEKEPKKNWRGGRTIASKEENKTMGSFTNLYIF